MSQLLPSEDRPPASEPSSATAVSASCRALAGGLENTARVLEASVRALGGRGEEEEDLKRRLQLAARRLSETAALVAGVSSDLSAPSARALGVTDQDECALGLRGHSEMIALTDFLSFLSNMGRDGVLDVWTETERFTVELRQGCVAYVTSDSPNLLRVGDLLLEQGLLEREGLQQALDERREGERVGDALLRLGLVDEEGLGTVLAIQMYQLCGRMHQDKSGFDFRFDEGRQAMPDTHARLGTSQFLLEGARLLDEGTLREREREPAVDLFGLGATDDGAEEEAGATWLANFAEDEGRIDVDSFRDFIGVLLLEDSLSLPCLADGTSRLLELAFTEDVDLKQVAADVQEDPTLVAHVLRAARDKEHAADDESIETPQAAVHLLGVAGLRELAQALTLTGRSFTASWERRINEAGRTAVLAGEFGALLGREYLENEELGRVLALMQDIGKPIVLGAIDDIEREYSCRLAPSAAEQLVDEFHQRAGAWLSRSWSFPESLTRVIEHHHDIDALSGPARTEALVAVTAHEVALAVERPVRPDLARLAQLSACQELGLDAEKLELLLEEHCDSITSPAA